MIIFNIKKKLWTSIKQKLINIHNSFFVFNVFSKLNKNLGGFTPIIDDTGKITGYKTSVGGADTVFPFRCNLNLLWSQEVVQNFINQTLNLDLSKYTKVLIKVVAFNTDTTYPTYQLIDKNSTKEIYASTTDGTYLAKRQVTINETGITFGTGGYIGNYSNVTNNNHYAIPIEIYGV